VGVERSAAASAGDWFVVNSRFTEMARNFGHSFATVHRGPINDLVGFDMDKLISFDLLYSSRYLA